MSAKTSRFNPVCGGEVAKLFLSGEAENLKNDYSSRSEELKWNQNYQNGHISKSQFIFDGEAHDKVLPSDKLYTCRPNGSVKIRESFEEDEPLISVPTFLKQSAEKFSSKPALAFKNNGHWNFITYREYLQIVRTVAKAFLKLGLERYKSVCILGYNTPEWPISNLAAIFAGGFSAGIYPSNSPEACLHCLKTSAANIVVVEDDVQLQKILKIKSHTPDLKVIIQYSGVPTDPTVLSWNQVLEIGNNESDHKLDEVIESLAVNQCCTLLYTSGTTSLPKAVMLSHDNVIFAVKLPAKFLKIGRTTERSFSYLPFNHIVAQTFDLYLCVLCGGCCYFADRDVLKSQELMIKNLKEVRPTYLFGVPRIWEKIKEQLQRIDDNLSTQESKIRKSSHLYGANMKAHVGLDECRAFLVGGAPLFPEVKKYLRQFDIVLREGYGMSEVGSAHIGSVDMDVNFESPGKALPGTRTKIDKPGENGVGEICVYGRNVFMGYLNEPEKTEETIDEDGWMHSGDLGKIDENSNLQICGRIKELLITSGGENVTPVLIENAIKSELPVVSQATVIGDRKKFLSLLITLKCEVDGDSGVPLDELSPEAKDWCRSLNCKCETVSEIIREKPHEVYDAIQKGIDRANATAISRVHQIRKFTILPRDFSFKTGELGPTTKVMRHVVYEKYKDEIEAMYAC